MIVHTLFIGIHFFNMFYMNNVRVDCPELEEPSMEITCDQSPSQFAIVDGRLNPAIVTLNWVEFLMSLYMISTELYELFTEGYNKYFDNWTWNLNDLIMPLSFIAGFYKDHDASAGDWVRSFYTLTTMSLLFVFL